jgi:arsenate reductase
VKLLKDRGIEPNLIKYLDEPPTEKELRKLAKMMGLRPNQFIRKRESEYNEFGLKDKLEDDDELFQQMAAHPRLIERPIAVKGSFAILGRPTERVLELL